MVTMVLHDWEDHFRGTMPEQQVPQCLLKGTTAIVNASQEKFGSKLPSRPFKSMLPPGTLDFGWNSFFWIEPPVAEFVNSRTP